MDNEKHGKLLSDKQRDQALAKLPGDLRKIGELIGLEPTLKLAREFRCTHLYIHNVDRIDREIRNEKIRTAYDKGSRVVDLALAFALSEKQIQNILGTAPADPDDLPLFKEMGREP